MEYQMSLFDKDIEKTDESTPLIKVLALNIQNPSSERARRQIEWIIERKPNILILTEVKDSSGFNIIYIKLKLNGYNIICNKSSGYFTVIAVKDIKYIEKSMNVEYERERVCAIELDNFIRKISLIGVYVPTNSNEIEKIILKKNFQNNFIQEIKKELYKSDNNSSFLIAGDFNILEPEHVPRYENFIKWNYFYNFFINAGFVDIFKEFNPKKIEYTWTFRGNSQRLDYMFISKELVDFVVDCKYIHETRHTKLSDHSAIEILFDRNKFDMAQLRYGNE